MNPDDEPSARPPPRGVPTLTEVVQAAAPPSEAPAPASLSQPASPTPPASHVALEPAVPAQDPVNALLERLGPELERQIAEAVGRVLHEQMLGCNSRVRKAVADVVRDTVADSLLQAGGRSDVSENPENQPSDT